MENRIDVLDHGYVRLTDWMGTDLSVVNAARVSFEKESPELDDRDRRLIKYLATHGHTSPFRHAVLQFEVYAPLMVARQWWKYVVGSDHTLEAWNESSRRYVTEEPTFYVPGRWRAAPASRKQGSDGFLDEPATDDLLSDLLRRQIVQGHEMYETAMSAGVAPEQARLFLPAYAMYVRWRWTTSLQALGHFLSQRLADDAQWEIRQYADAVYRLAEPVFPASIWELV